MHNNSFDSLFQNCNSVQPVSFKYLLVCDESIAKLLRNEFLNLSKSNTNDIIGFCIIDPTNEESILQIENNNPEILKIWIFSNDNFSNTYFNYITKSFLTNTLFVHPSLAHDQTYKSALIHLNSEGKFKARFIGHQTHLTPFESIKELELNHIESLRLGLVRQNIDRIEPWCRSIDHAFFYTSALRKTDFPAKESNNMGGFTYEEACKISQFIGSSAHLKSIAFLGYNLQKDPDQISISIIAQLVWYLLDGARNFKEDKSIEKSKLTQYIVHASHNDLDINFWKNNESGRWWMEVPGHENYWISCTYDDYLEASHGEFSTKLIQLLNKS